MDRILGRSCYMIVNTSCEHLGPKPPVHQPFLVKRSSQGFVASHNQVEDVHAAEGDASRLPDRVEVRIAGRQSRTSEAQQKQSSEDTALTREVDQKIVSEV